MSKIREIIVTQLFNEMGVQIGLKTAPLVRCKDCKYKEHCFSMVHMFEESERDSVNRDIDYCSYGERKEQDHDD